MSFRCGECEAADGAHASHCSCFNAPVGEVGPYLVCGSCGHAEGNPHAPRCVHATVERHVGDKIKGF